MIQNKYIVKLEGGLGNQLFQYTHALALCLRYGGIIILDKHAFNKKQIRQCALENYKLNNNVRFKRSTLQKLLTCYFLLVNHLAVKFGWTHAEKGYHTLSKFGLYYQYQIRWFDSFVKPIMPVNYVTGNWLSSKFFEGAEECIRNDLKYQKNLPEKCNEFLAEILQSEAVCIHIRLGDYIAPQWKDKLYVCTPDYYHQAMALIREKVKNPRFFVFSNRPKDFEMIRNEYDLGNVIYVDMGNSDVEDMELMRNCKHFIMSNSTYSWWAQYLSENERKVVVAPSRFNNYPEWDMTDIYQENWEIVEI